MYVTMNAIQVLNKRSLKPIYNNKIFQHHFLIKHQYLFFNFGLYSLTFSTYLKNNLQFHKLSTEVVCNV